MIQVALMVEHMFADCLWRVDDHQVRCLGVFYREPFIESGRITALFQGSSSYEYGCDIWGLCPLPGSSNFGCDVWGLCPLPGSSNFGYGYG